MEFKTPDSIVAELVEIRHEAARGVDALHNAEMELATASLAADIAESKALLSSEGNVAERQAFAKIESADARLTADVARAAYNRIKMKIRILEQGQMSVQTQARMIELMYKTAGTGEK
jgi:hypothetical protein